MAVQKRRSKQRDAILQWLQGVTSHPTAETVYAAVKEEIPNISLGTVYRNLKGLAEEKVILSFTLNGVERFDGNVKPHLHFCCDNCGKIEDRILESEVKQEIMNKTGFSVHNIVINGNCNNCLDNKN